MVWKKWLLVCAGARLILVLCNGICTAEEIRKEIAQLEQQQVVVITGDGALDNLITRYEASCKEVQDLRALLAETLRSYRPTSEAVAKVCGQLDNAMTAQYELDAMLYETLDKRIGAKEAAYKESMKELLPTGPKAKALADEIEKLKIRRQAHAGGYWNLRCKPGQVMTNSIGMKLVWIPPGHFIMGSPDSEAGRDPNEGPQHLVWITNGFWMGQTEVTQAQYETLIGTNPSNFKGSDNLPVERVTWEDVQEYCRKLSQKEGRAYRLPTEAEWEYACRSQTSGVYAGDLDAMAWYGNNSSSKTHPVGTKTPNGFGLYDMHGNVLEWCQDWFIADYYKTSLGDPQGPDSGSHRVLRGGSWFEPPTYCRAAIRFKGDPGFRRDIATGFRVVYSVGSAAGSPSGGDRASLLAPIGDQKLRSCQLAYMNEVGPVSAGVTMGEVLDRLSSKNVNNIPIQVTSADGRTVVSIKAKEHRLQFFFTGDGSQGVCVVTGGQFDDIQINRDEAFAVLYRLCAQ